MRIFRRHGFAWGGNFLTPDGMHFEWVGEDRSKISYLPLLPERRGAQAAAAEVVPSGPVSMQEPYEEE